MSIFKKCESRQAKLKMGIYGSAGSGKTWTAAEIMRGLHKHTKSKKPVYMLDTETGADFINERIFKPEGIELRVGRSRSFVDVCSVLREAEADGFGVIIDSITHVWDDFTASYKKKLKQNFIELWDWKPIKDEWRRFTDLYINSNVHVILLGRSGAVYETVEEKRGGEMKEKSVKVGTKMRAEGEMGYEPSLLVEMEKEFHTGEGDGTYYRMARVIKDRFNAIDSKEFKNPKFSDFMPYINLLDLEGEHQGIDPTRNSEAVFDSNGDTDYSRRAKRRAILCEEIQGMLLHYIQGAGTKEKDARQELVFKHFGTRSWKALEEDWKAVPLEKLEEAMKPGEGAPSAFEAACIKEGERFQGEKK